MIRKATERFSDIKLTDWFAAPIAFLVDKGIIQGDGDSVHPNKKICRADFLIMIMRAYGIELDADLNGNFADIQPTDYYAAYFAKAKAIELVGGDDWGNSNALSDISRQDMCVMLYRIQLKIGKLPAAKVSNEIAGMDEVSDYARTAVETYIAADILHGMDGGVNARGATTRGQAAQMLYNLLK
jgi:hypothetical protein